MTKGVIMSYSLHDTLTSYYPEYRRKHAAEQAIIDSNRDLLYEIKGLRRDVSKTNGELSDNLAYAILRLIERLEQS